MPPSSGFGERLPNARQEPVRSSFLCSEQDRQVDDGEGCLCEGQVQDFPSMVPGCSSASPTPVKAPRAQRRLAVGVVVVVMGSACSRPPDHPANVSTEGLPAKTSQPVEFVLA